MTSHPVVYIVDDDESVRESLTGLLRSFGFDARPFASAEAFLGSAPSDAACVVLDVTMPGMSGAELQGHMLQAGPRMPIVFITARIEDGLRMKLLSRGAVACLVKPFQEDDLLNAVRLATSVANEGKP
jgi:FixJ family two-component response regulator